jgi:hypothetical protein
MAPTNLGRSNIGIVNSNPIEDVDLYNCSSVAYNFQAGNNKMKMITEYESVSQKFFIWQPCTLRIDVLSD